MNKVDICYNYLHNKIEKPSSDERVILKKYKLTGRPYLIGDRRATRSTVSSYIKDCDNGYSGGFDAYCRSHGCDDKRTTNSKSRDKGYREGDTKGAHILKWFFIALVIYVIVAS